MGDLERSPSLEIAGRRIGWDAPPYIVAEISGNHRGELETALRLVALAKAAGADAVKLQSYTADTITLDHDGPEFRLEEGLWQGRTLYELYRECHTPWDWHGALFDKAAEEGIAIFSSPFDESAVDFLEELKAPAYKIASYELVDLPLVRHAATTGKPLILSTGMADKPEIAAAVEAARDAGCRELALLHCVSGYPTPLDQANLRRIARLREDFGVVAGLSDHSEGTAVATAAVAAGASLIEKHFIDSRAAGGPDAAFSLEPDELKTMVEACRAAWQALGDGTYDVRPSEAAGRAFRPSLYAVADIAAGETLTAQNVRSIRPSNGLAPRHLPEVLGRRALYAIPRGTPLSWDLIEAGDAG